MQTLTPALNNQQQDWTGVYCGNTAIFCHHFNYMADMVLCYLHHSHVVICLTDMTQLRSNNHSV